MKIDKDEIEFHLFEIESSFRCMLESIKDRRGNIEYNDENISSINGGMNHLKYHVDKLHDLTNHTSRVSRRRNKKHQ